MKPDNESYDSYDHERVNLLLPWLVNDTLGDAEKSAAERHLRECAVCRDDRQLLERMQEGIRNDALTPIVPKADPHGLLGRLNDQAASARPPGAAPSKRLVTLAVAASLVLLALALFRLDIPAPPPTAYETATGSGAASMDYVLRVGFEPGTTESERLAVLRSLDARDVVSDGADGYRATIRLTIGSMEQLQRYTDEVSSMPGVGSANVVAIQLPVRAEP